MNVYDDPEYREIMLNLSELDIKLIKWLEK